MVSEININDIASVFGGNIVPSNDDDKVEMLEHMYKPTESVFGAVGQQMVDAGWSVFPQEITGNRRPGTVDDDMIKWSEDHDLANKKPTPEALAKWVQQCAALNVAVVLGPASGNTFVIDIDVVEEELSQQIQELAVRLLGDTPLKRVGRWPKMAFVYRHKEEDEISSRAFRFVGTQNPENDAEEDQLLEIIGSGKAMTFYGKHHKTGRYFQWIEGPPHIHGPETVPLVTSSQLGDFIDAVDSLRPFTKSTSFELLSTTFEWDENEKIHKPRLRSYGATNDWTENDDGKIVDGREMYLTRLAMRTVKSNYTMCNSEQGIEALVMTVLEIFNETAELTGRWRGSRLLNEVKSKVRRFSKQILSGEIKGEIPQKDGEGKYVQSSSSLGYIPAQPRRANGDSLDFLPPFVDPTSPSFSFRKKYQRRPMRIKNIPSTDEEIEQRRIERQISEDRSEVADAVSVGLMKAFNTFWDEVYDKTQNHSRVHILKAPPGAGKTSRGINFIASDPRTKEPYTIYGDTGEIVHEGQSPILVLMPTYANIDELRDRALVLNLDPSLPDKELMEQAKEALNLSHVDELEGRLADLRRDAMSAGLKTMIYSGKLKAGCKMEDKVKLAMSAGLGTAGFCKAEVPTDEIDDETGKPIKEEKFCPFYHQYSQNEDGSWNKCPAIQQKEEISSCHVIFLPHAFLALNIPDELKNVRAVVADERIHHLFLHTLTFSVNVFASPRKPPKLTKKEKEQGLIAEEFQTDRLAAVGEALYALKTRQDPAEMLIKKGQGLPGNGLATVERWIDAALRSCGASIAKDSNITPEITIEDLEDICARPTGVSVREEYRFWKIVQERFEARRMEIPLEEMEHANRDNWVKGEKDMRIQLFEDEVSEGVVEETIRISWRETPNWVERPLFLLDASAAPEMIKKIWHGKDVIVHDIPAALNVRIVGVADRTYSNSSVVAKPNATEKEKVRSAQLLAKVRKAISVISGYYGYSRVVAGGSILARRTINTNWEGPHNVDWCHFGAMRGLDFAKYHAAAISVGRMELPVRVTDGLVAALTYDDDEPEQPFDKAGTGLSEAGRPLLIPTQDQLVRMRSGHDFYMPVPTFPGKWGRMIQKQYREEELLQFLGRLRPVYREGESPIWFSLSSVIPEEIIIDDLVNIDDIIRKKGRETPTWDALRRCQGILDVEATALICDDLFGDSFMVIDAFKNEGINPKTGNLNSRVAWSIVTMKWKNTNGEEGYSFARADISEPEEALRNIRRSCGLPDLVSVEKVSQSKGQTAARGRTPDTIEEEIGPLSERRDKEVQQQIDVAIRALMETSAEAIEHLKQKKLTRAVPVMLPTGVRTDEENEDSPEIMSNLTEIEAAESINHMWKITGYEITKQTQSVNDNEKLDASISDDKAIAITNNSDDKEDEFNLYNLDEDDIAIPF